MRTLMFFTNNKTKQLSQLLVGLLLLQVEALAVEAAEEVTRMKVLVMIHLYNYENI
jgi:hypothetical protein